MAQQTITTGEMINGKWLVTSGLKAGDRVIVDGLQNVRSGAKVNASESQDKRRASGQSVHHRSFSAVSEQISDV